MPLLVLALALGVFMHDQYWHGRPTESWATLLGLVLGGNGILLALYAGFCALLSRQLRRGHAGWALRWQGRVAFLLRLGLLKVFALALLAGWLRALRSALGDWILLDELLAMLPTLLAVTASWWLYYPIDRRLREASLLRQIDEGRPIFPIWSRGQYVLAQVRHQLALVGVPLLILMAWTETVYMLGPRWLGERYAQLGSALVLAGAGGVFVFAPLMIRCVWDTVPLPPGSLRQRLEAMCARHRVGVRQLLLWRTFGGMINAAVMGVARPVRFILLSDALLEMLPEPQVEAVMAHELGHVRKHHLVWLLIAAAAAMMGLQVLLTWPLFKAFQALESWSTAPSWLEPARLWLAQQDVMEVTITALTLVGWVLIFGWVSRRFERQADTFAVVHLAQSQPDAPEQSIGPAAAYTMIAALQQVAQLNHIPIEKNSWRHGSIQWRQQYLATLVGQRIGTLPIDVTVRWINRASFVVLAVVILLQWPWPGAAG